MQTLRIVVASPSDVAEERQAVDRVVDELNRGVAADRGITLQVVRWETDAYPGFHVDGPQGLIDPLLRIEDSDCVIGVFWKRFGTPVKDAGSGTEHELLAAYDAWKSSGRPNLMVYFCDRPYAPKSPEEAEQWKRVLIFRATFPGEGLWWAYTQPADFEQCARSHLTLWLRRTRPVQVDRPTSEVIPDRRAYIDRYRALIDGTQHDLLIMANKFHRSEVTNEIAQINRSLREVSQRGVRIRMLNGAGFDRLPGALELAIGCGAEVRFDPELPMSDMNFACSDGQHVLIGLRQALPDRAGYRQSSSWSEFQSTHLAATLRREFDRRWRAARTRSLRFLIRELLPAAIDELGVDGVGTQLHVDSKWLQGFIDSPPIIVGLIGRPGAGKTTVANALLRTLELALPGLRANHVSDLAFLREAFSTGKSSGRYEVTDDGGFFITDRTLYREALAALAGSLRASMHGCDLVLAEFARNEYVAAFALLEEQGIRPDLIVYIDVPFAVARERNRLRAASGQGHFVSEREMLETYIADDLAELQKIRKVAILANEEFKWTTAEQATSTVLEIVRELTAKV